MWTQEKRANCWRRYCLCRLATKPRKPGVSAATLCRLTKNVEHEADEAVVLGKRNEERVDKDNVLKVVDDGLAVEEVVCDDEEVPVERLAPRVALVAGAGLERLGALWGVSGGVGGRRTHGRGGQRGRSPPCKR